MAAPVRRPGMPSSSSSPVVTPLMMVEMVEIPPSLAEIEPILQVAKDVEATNPCLARTCRYYAYIEAQRLDPTSDDGVLQFKIKLRRSLERENNPRLGQIYAHEIQSFSIEYFNRAMENAKLAFHYLFLYSPSYFTAYYIFTSSVDKAYRDITSLGKVSAFIKVEQADGTTRMRLKRVFNEIDYETNHNVSLTKRKHDHLRPYYKDYHHLFLCKYEKGKVVDLANYAATNRTVHSEVPVGGHGAKDFLYPADHTRLVLQRALKILYRLHHQENKTLNGEYDFTNFVVNGEKRVLLDNIEPGYLLNLTNKRSDWDYHNFALETQDKFFPREIPTEMKPWFKMLVGKPTRHEYLIVHSIVLMESKEAIDHFKHLYDEFLKLKKDDCDYKEIIAYLNERHVYRKEEEEKAVCRKEEEEKAVYRKEEEEKANKRQVDWKEKAKNNSYTRRVLERRDSNYGDHASHLLRLCRNLISHMDLRKMRYKDYLAIINSVFPELLSDFEFIFHETRNLQAVIQFQ